MQKAEEFIARFRARPHATQHAARGSRAGSFLDAAHHHTKVARFHDDGDPLWLQYFGYGESNLFCKPLLDLQSA